MERRVACAAQGLDSAGVGEDDVVALMLRNEPAYLEAMLACRRIGAYHCPINWHFRAEEAGFILRDCGAKALVCSPELRVQIEDGIPAGLRVVDDWPRWRETHAPWTGAPRAPRSIMPYTSGTTGRPKGVKRVPASDEQRKLAAEL